MLPIAPISNFLLSKVRIFLIYLILIFIGLFSSIVFRFNLFQFLNVNNIFILPIIVLACTFLFFVITIIIKRIVFFKTYLIQVQEGVKNNLCSKKVKPLFIFKVCLFSLLSIMYVYNFIRILLIRAAKTEPEDIGIDLLCILFLALIFYLQFYYLGFNKENYYTNINFKQNITRKLILI